MAASSAPNPEVNGASCAIKTRPVFLADYTQWNGRKKNNYKALIIFIPMKELILLGTQFLDPMAKLTPNQSLHNRYCVRSSPFRPLR